MVDPEKRPLLTEKQRGRLLTFFVVYTILFVVVGPKFSLFAVYDEIQDGVFESNRIYGFVGGSHQGDTVKLCFEGRLLGENTQMMYTADLAALEQPKQRVEGLGEVRFNEEDFDLYSRDFEPGCQSLGESNVSAGKLPDGAFSIGQMLRDRENQPFLNGLESGAYVLFYSLDHKDRVSKASFALFQKEGGSLLFYEYRLYGGIQKESDLGAWDYAKAFLTDYLLWPYIIFLLFSGAASH